MAEGAAELSQSCYAEHKRGAGTAAAATGPPAAAMRSWAPAPPLPPATGTQQGLKGQEREAAALGAPSELPPGSGSLQQAAAGSGSAPRWAAGRGPLQLPLSPLFVVLLHIFAVSRGFLPFRSFFAANRPLSGSRRPSSQAP